MPARNVTKTYVEDSYYHIYNRGVSKQQIFLDEQDYTVFLGLLKRYLGQDSSKQANRINYPNYMNEVELIAYCIMPNHFHLLLYQYSIDGIKKLLKSVSVSYAMYFNKKYDHQGALFQQRYRAVHINDESQFAHISRYIHMNPNDYLHWPWSSLSYFIGKKQSDWLHIERVPHTGDYLKFLDEYKQRRDELKHLSDELAG